MNGSTTLKLMVAAAYAVAMMTSFSTPASAAKKVGMVINNNAECSVDGVFAINGIFGKLTKPEGAGGGIERLKICAGLGKDTVLSNPGSKSFLE